MASLSPPFILCPLSDRKELLGISEDRLENKAIITIGRNIAIRYHVLEQKQETSWTSSRHWLTSKVVYCAEFEKYGAVIDHNVVALWDENDTTLSRLKKFKFEGQITELRPTRTLGTLVIFCNGIVISLTAVVDVGSKEVPLIDTNTEVLLDVAIDEKNGTAFIASGLIDANNKDTTISCITKRNQVKITSSKLCAKQNDPDKPFIRNEPTGVTEVILEQEDIVGFCIVPLEKSCLLYLRSDGFLYKQSLVANDYIENNVDKHSQGIKIACMTKYVSQVNPVVMRVMEDGSTLIIYCCDPSEEGATLFIYDTNYDLLLSKQSLKLYATPPIMDIIGHSIFVPVGLHILVLNYRTKKSLLSSVVGQHQLRPDEEAFVDRNPWGVKGWEVDANVGHRPRKQKKQKIEAEKKRKIQKIMEEFPTFYETILTIRSLESDGQPESIICKQTIEPAVESKNFDAVEWLMVYFDDIPEVHLVKMVALYLEKLKVTTLTRINGINGNGSTANDEGSDSEEAMETYEQNKMLNALLQRQFDNFLLIKSLRNLDFEMVKRLLVYLTSLMETSWEFTCDDDSRISFWIRWTSALLDAHHTKFVFHDEIKIVDRILKLINEKSLIMSEIEAFEPLLRMTVAKTKFEPGSLNNRKFRTDIVTFV